MHSRSLDPQVLLSHTDFVQSLARRLLGESQAADDLAQETFVRALERPPATPTNGGGLKGWLGVVTRNFARQDARSGSRRRLRELAVAREVEVPSTADVLEREAVRAEIVRAVLALDAPYREVLLLRYYEDQPPRDIAAKLQLPVETVRTRIKRGLASLRGVLGHHAEEEGWSRALAAIAITPRDFATGAQAVGMGTLGGFGKLLAVAGLMAVSSLVYFQLRPGEESSGQERARAAQTAAPETVVEVAALDTPAIVGGRTSVPIAPTSTEVVVSGVVRGPSGEPIVGTDVFWSATGPPPVRGRGRIKWMFTELERGDVLFTKTDGEGRFRFSMDDKKRAFVGAVFPTDPFLWADEGQWVDGATEELVVALVEANQGIIEFDVRRSDTAEPVLEYVATVHRVSDRLSLTERASGERLVFEVPFADGDSRDEFDVLVTSEGLGEARMRVTVGAGERVKAELEFAGSRALYGLVVDSAGAPVPDALVYSGVMEHLRGDEPFKPFVPARIKDGVQTDAEGTFLIEAASSPWVTVWHAKKTPVTVRAEFSPTDPQRIVLPERSAIEGLLLDEVDRPVTASIVYLDRVREAVTDAQGRFRFDAVEAGVRGLRLESGRMFGLEVPAGETLEVTLTTGLPSVRIELQQGGEPYTRSPKGQAVVIGEGEIFGVDIAPVFAGAVELEGVLAGPVTVLTSDGLIVQATIDSAASVADVGTARLVIHATPGRSLYVAPADAHELVPLMANRVAARRVPTSGELVFEPLPRGTYVVGSEGYGPLGQVRIETDEAEITIP